MPYMMPRKVIAINIGRTVVAKTSALGVQCNFVTKNAPVIRSDGTKKEEGSLCKTLCIGVAVGVLAPICRRLLNTTKTALIEK